MSDSSCRNWIIVRVVSRYRVESDTSRPSVPLRFAMRDITLSADTRTRTRLSWFLCAASSRSRKSCDADRMLELASAELLRMVASWPLLVAESTRPSVACTCVAALATACEPSRRLVPTEPITSACSLVTCTSRSAMRPKSLIERRSSFTASESNAVWMRFDTVAMSVAMRLACAVSWPMSGSVAPGHLPLPPACASAIACLMFGSFGSWSSETSDAADADATQDDRVPDVQTADGPEPGGVDRLRAPDVGTREPQGAAYHDRERRDHDEADDELVLALHPGRPSMNCRTTGSSICWICSTVPTCRILPSYNMAMRSPTV